MPYKEAQKERKYGYLTKLQQGHVPYTPMLFGDDTLSGSQVTLVYPMPGNKEEALQMVDVLLYRARRIYQEELQASEKGRSTSERKSCRSVGFSTVQQAQRLAEYWNTGQDVPDASVLRKQLKKA